MVEEENKDFANRYIEVEAENNNLANLYVASYQLHSTLDFSESLKIILEIVMNLIGAEEFSIMMLDEKTNEMTIVAQEGMGPEARASVKLGDGIIGKAAKAGECVLPRRRSHGPQERRLSPPACRHPAQDQGARDRRDRHLQAPGPEGSRSRPWTTSCSPCLRAMRPRRSFHRSFIRSPSASSRRSRAFSICSRKNKRRLENARV